MNSSTLEARRRRLHIPRRSLSRLANLSLEVVKSVLSEPEKATKEHLVAVGGILGVDYENHKKRSTEKVFKSRLLEKAKYVVKMVQGSQGLEASAVGQEGYRVILKAAIRAIRSGEKRKIWDED